MSLPSGVEAHVILADGGDGGALTDREEHLVLKTGALLKADPHWVGLTDPTLSRIEANRGLTDTTPGFLYLRYRVTGGGPQEFWAHWGNHDHVSWTTGQVSVKAGP